jgi:UDP-glucuronate 4-epimerase
MFGDGSTSRDYTYVDDIVQGVAAAIDYTGSQFEIDQSWQQLCGFLKRT